jgi:hypothetical protein
LTRPDPYPETSLSRAIRDHRFPLIVSLPRHDLGLAQAAAEAGADALKLHLNVNHRASGTRFGSFEEERPFFESVRTIGLPLLVVPGAEHVPDETEMAALSDLGVEGFNVYARHLQPHLLSGRMRPMPALDEDYSEMDIDRMSAIPGAWIEASIMPFALYRTPLVPEDFARFVAISQRAGVPVLVPSQKTIAPSDIAPLRRSGIAGVILGAVATGHTPEGLRRAVAGIAAAREQALQDRTE